MKKQFRKGSISFKFHNKNSDIDIVELKIDFDCSTEDDSNYSDSQLSYYNPDLIEEDSDDE